MRHFSFRCVAALLVTHATWAADARGESVVRQQGTVTQRKERTLTLLAGGFFEGSPLGLGVRLSVEGKLGPRVGLGGAVGAAVLTLDRPDDKLDFGTAGVASISPRYYAIGTFEHGMQLGGEVTAGAGVFKQFLGCLHVGNSPCVNPESVRGFVAIVPVVGYKYTAPVGFTLEVQAGLGAVASSAGIAPWTKGGLSVGWAF
jgi:hypothetical protein